MQLTDGSSAQFFLWTTEAAKWQTVVAILVPNHEDIQTLSIASAKPGVPQFLIQTLIIHSQPWVSAQPGVLKSRVSWTMWRWEDGWELGFQRFCVQTLTLLPCCQHLASSVSCNTWCFPVLSGLGVYWTCWLTFPKYPFCGVLAVPISVAVRKSYSICFSSSKKLLQSLVCSCHYHFFFPLWFNILCVLLLFFCLFGWFFCGVSGVRGGKHK